jgi:hypothetical protein
MTTARILVRAVIVSDGRSPVLADVLDAISSQEYMPDSVHLVTLGDAEIPTPQGLDVTTSAAPASASLGEAFAAALADLPAQEAEYLWLLHDDSAPQADVLAKLAATARKRPRAAIVGAAQVRWKTTSRLISLGSTVSRVGARRIDLIDDNDINQGQYDARDDVLAVSIAGALLRRDVWEQLGGFDDGYRGFGESADYCRRAWRAGYDVVVVPSALVRHRQLNLHGARDEETRGRGSRTSYATRRTSEWYHALVWEPPLAVPILVLWAFASSLFRALLRVAQNEPRMALVDLGIPWRLLGRCSGLARSRRRARRHATVPARAISRLLAGPGAVVHHVRTRYLRAYDKWRLAVTPTGMIRTELAASGQRRRWMLGVVVVVSLGLSVAVFGDWLPDLLAGKMLSGAALGVTDVGWHELWQRSWTGWSDVGYGTASLDGSFSAALVPFAILPGGLRLGLGLVLAFGVTLAAISAWFAVGAATRAVSVRAVAALAYAAWPPFLVSIAQGRVGAVLAHIALPFVALGVARALGWYRGEALAHGEEFTARRSASPSAAAVASLAFAFCVAVAPVLLVPGVVALALVAACAGRRWPRILLATVPALLVSARGIMAASHAGSLRDAWAVLAREPGPAAPSEVSSPLKTLLTLDTSPGGTEWFAQPGVVGAIAATVCVAALLALLSSRATRAVCIGWAVAALGLGATFAAQRVTAVWPDGSGSAAANGWSGPGLSFALVGALAAAAAASSGVWHGKGAVRLRRVGAVIVVTLAAAAVLTSATAWAWPGRAQAGDVAAVNPDVLPLVAALEQEPPGSARVLVLQDTDAGVAYSVETSDGAVALEGTAAFDEDGVPLSRPGTDAPPSPAGLADAVATLVAAGVGADEDLAAWGIGVIVATADSTKVLAGLAQVDTLELIGASGSGTAYRVPHGGVAASRAWIESDSEPVVVPMDGASGGGTVSAGEGGTLVLSVPKDPAWSATLSGKDLEAVADDQGRQAFAVPATGGTLVVTFHDSDYRAWWWAAAIACMLALIAALPLQNRRLLGVRS